MRLNRLVTGCVLFICLAAFCSAGAYFPDIPGYRTLVCDLHTHTVFSDGLVWPTVRIDEAKREGLDAIAISDHIEYQPHKDDIPTNHNRSYAIAQEQAQKQGILLIKAAEITRDTPPGHYNALFVDDIDELVIEAFLEVIEQANAQNAFVFWNHHTWKGAERGRWTDLQTRMLENGWLHGMEVANGGTYYPDAHRWCLEKDMTMLGNSDIHDPSLYTRYTPERHRTVTLIFARERSLPAIEEALRAGRTVVWHRNRLIGKAAYLRPLFEQSVTVDDVQQNAGRLVCTVTNDALMDFELQRVGADETVTLPARSTVDVAVAIDADTSVLSYRVGNLLVAPGQGLLLEFSVPESIER